LLQETGTEILREVNRACQRASIPILAVKGIVTARVLYSDAADRPITDVDVRIRRQDFERFRRAARASGWKCVRLARSYGNLVYDFGALSLDVEAYVGPPGLCSLGIDTMLDRSVWYELIPGLHVRVPELHDHAVLLTVNAFKDKITTATPWAIADLERIVGHAGFNPDVFVQRVRISRVATLAWIVASWMESARSNAAWGRIRVAIESRAEVRHIYARLLQRQLASADRAPMSLRLLARSGADSPRMQLIALVRAVLWSAESRLRGFDAAEG
jgi:hypothetical protein